MVKKYGIEVKTQKSGNSSGERSKNEASLDKASVPSRGHLSKKISPVYLFHILEIFLVLYDCRKFK